MLDRLKARIRAAIISFIKRNRNYFIMASLAVCSACAAFAYLSLNPAFYTPPQPTTARLLEASNTPARAAVQPTYTSLPTYTPLPTYTQPAVMIAAQPLAATPLPPTATVRPTAVPFDDYADILIEVFADPDLPEVVKVQMADGRANGGERAAIVAYATDETTQQAFNNEWIALLTAFGKKVQSDNLDIDAIGLVFGPSQGDAYGIFTAQVPDVRAFISGKITRAELLKRAKFAPLAYPASAKSTQPPVLVRATNTVIRPPVSSGGNAVNPPAAPSCPSNCTEARAQGVSAEDAAACGLDRDGDGVACYGD